MKLKLNKKKMKSLSKDNKIAPSYITPQVAGGENPATNFEICDGTGWCHTAKPNRCGPDHTDGCNHTISDTFTGLDKCQSGVCLTTRLRCP